jgi:hypothetical protein
MANFRTKNTGTWFYFDPDKPDSGGVCLRLLPGDERTRIEKATTVVTKSIVAGEIVEKKKTNDKLESEMIFGYCIVGWADVSIDGVERECTIANKVMAMKSLDFARFVNQSIKTLADTNEAIQEVLLKNSESTSAGSEINPIVQTVNSPSPIMEENQTAQNVE